MSEQKDRWTQLAETARELNKVLGLEPEIPTSDVSEAELEEKLEEAAALVAPEDEFTDQTAYILSEFTEVVDVPEDFEIEVEESEAEEPEEVEETEEVEAEEVEEAEEAEEKYTLEEIREFVETTNKRKDLRIFAGEFPDIFENSIDKMNKGGLRDAKALRESMLSDLDETEAEEAEEDWDEEESETEIEETEVEEEKLEKSKEKSSSGKKKPVQSNVIREGITDGCSRDKIIKILNEVFEKGESWAKSRMNTYERAYGEMGENDPKLD